MARSLRAAALALREFPELNARLEGDEIVLLDRYDLGIAVQTDDGLVVPVVRGCDTRPVEELDADVRRLADAARAGTLAADELRGSTFTVTSAGRLGGVLVTPLINHPEVAILGLHRVGPRPVVRDGEIVVRQMGNVSVTFDHRVVDGLRAAEFCLDVIGRLEGAGDVTPDPSTSLATARLQSALVSDWYEIGMVLGLGLAAGVFFAGVVGAWRVGWLVSVARLGGGRSRRRPARSRLARHRRPAGPGWCRGRRDRLRLGRADRARRASARRHGGRHGVPARLGVGHDRAARPDPASPAT